MKKKLLKLGIIFSVFVFGLGLVAVHSNKEPDVVYAANQHVENYDPYTYSGSYYSSINTDELTEGLEGTLRQKLTTLIHPTKWYTYGSSGATHLSTQLQYADEDPTNSSNMVYLYTRDSVKKNAASSWNREHVWPQSLSGPTTSQKNWGTSEAGTDVLHIRPTYNDTNNDRDNDIYADTNKANPKTYNGMIYGYETGTRFEPLDSVKGDVARIIMYVWVAYRNHYATLQPITKVFESYDTLLKWHAQDRPDVMEGNRNDYCEKDSIQGNRNPFVDHPEYAWMVFGNSASISVKQQCMEAYPDGDKARITGITLSGEPTKKVYTAGESFDPTGLTVTATYSDDTTTTIENSKCTWEPNKLSVGVTAVTCKYSGFSATYNGITVNPAPAPTIKGTYGICFKNMGAESTNPITASEILSTYTADNTLVESITDARNVYVGEFGLRLDMQSSMTFNLKNIAKTPDIESIYFVTKPINSETEVDVKLNDEDVSFESSDDTHTIHIAGYFDEGLTSVTISSSKSFLLSQFGIYVKQAPQPTSSSAPEQSSEPERSSSSASSSEGGDKKGTGCNGSIIGAISATAFSGALLGLIFAFSKKKEK